MPKIIDGIFLSLSSNNDGKNALVLLKDSDENTSVEMCNNTGNVFDTKTVRSGVTYTKAAISSNGEMVVIVYLNGEEIHMQAWNHDLSDKFREFKVAEQKLGSTDSLVSIGVTKLDAYQAIIHWNFIKDTSKRSTIKLIHVKKHSFKYSWINDIEPNR